MSSTAIINIAKIVNYIGKELEEQKIGIFTVLNRKEIDIDIVLDFSQKCLIHFNALAKRTLEYRV